MKKLTRIEVVLLASLALLVGFSAAAKALAEEIRADKSDHAPAVRYQINDAHLHYVDFLQQTDGIDALLNKMDSAGVARENFLRILPGQNK